VADLNGKIHVVLDGRIDSVNGGIRSTFEAVPDAPVTKFVLAMAGGKKGLIENSTDLCTSAHHATAKFTGHNGGGDVFHPTLPVSCGKDAKRGHRRMGGSRRWVTNLHLARQERQILKPAVVLAGE